MMIKDAITVSGTTLHGRRAAQARVVSSKESRPIWGDNLRIAEAVTIDNNGTVKHN